jgi:predicted TIM-barrel fold metal-dependent hydrolase
MVLDRHYTPGEATLADLRAHMARIGFERAVIVQPSVYGNDNSYLLESLEILGKAGRGVAVVNDDSSDESLRTLSKQGIRGLRVNLESSGIRDPALMGNTLAFWAERSAFLSWHIQVFATLDAIVAAIPYINALPVPIVLDHFALATYSVDDARLEAVLSLLRAGRVYVKLSAPYRLGASTQANELAAIQLAKAFVRANPEQVLWGSDWPHTNREIGKAAHDVSAYRQLEPNSLTQGIETWLPTSALRETVLVKNPDRIYGFQTSAR